MFPTLSSGYLLTQDHVIGYSCRSNYLNVYRQQQGATAMQKTLYIATFDVGYTHTLRVFYAADEAESQQKKQDLEREINTVCKSLEHYPNGFRLVMSTLPGTVEVTEEVQPRTIEV